MNILTIVISSIGAITGILGLILSILSYQRNKFETINSFFQYMRDNEFLQARKFIYNLQDNTVINASSSEDDNNKVAIVANAYHHWGLLVKHKQLPLWIFYDRNNGLTASGIAVIRMYKKLVPTINYRHQNGNPKYAEYYKWLYNKLTKKDPSYIDLIH